MKPLPLVVLQLLETLPEETCKIILNTNRRGHWEVEIFTRYSLDEPVACHGVTDLVQRTRATRSSRTGY